MPSINFFSQDINFKLPQSQKTKRWLKEVIRREHRKLNSINYIFCSDEHLLTINRQYLKHETLTDIITFDNSDESDEALEADIFISIDRIRDNSATIGVEFRQELHRVMVHGVLHLLGYDDNTAQLKACMRDKEDSYLSLRSELVT